MTGAFAFDKERWAKFCEEVGRAKPPFIAPKLLGKEPTDPVKPTDTHDEWIKLNLGGF